MSTKGKLHLSQRVRVVKEMCEEFSPGTSVNVSALDSICSITLSHCYWQIRLSYHIMPFSQV